ncbi:MAG TPA: dual specificity protein phosphatase family protein [Steroidobacteraceae bacterium]
MGPSNFNYALESTPPNSYWVIPGRLLAGGYPASADFSESRAQLARVQEAGIDYFIDLTEEGELPPYRHLLPFHVKYLRCPIPDHGVPALSAPIKRLLSDIRIGLAAKRCIYVHCRAGIGRTNLIIGCYLAEQQGDGKAALEHVNSLWRRSARAAIWPKVPETSEQADYVQRWPNLARQHS